MRHSREKYCDIYGPNAVSVRETENWFKRFQSGNCDVKDEPSSLRIRLIPLEKVQQVYVNHDVQNRRLNVFFEAQNGNSLAVRIDISVLLGPKASLLTVEPPPKSNMMKVYHDIDNVRPLPFSKLPCTFEQSKFRQSGRVTIRRNGVISETASCGSWRFFLTATARLQPRNEITVEIVINKFISTLPPIPNADSPREEWARNSSRTAKPNNWRHTDAGIQRVYRRQCAKSRFGVRYSIRTRSQKVSAQMQITGGCRAGGRQLTPSFGRTRL
ncbi:hypothetical protein EVAR_13067_1 [Eumeta japonica]|uniref:Mos1 transposase HTH domain-containing protein n=1 Tax=Eumeta variegata TaxID=151549 RepID=A0A4C1VIB0_EUMVA|nr:hypothetical protein EVAR_13067_1 [Eumeta japonica]